MARTFAGKTVIVTGGANGLGAALCRRFGRAGAKVAALDLDPARLSAFEAELRAAGTTALGLACDVRDPAACGAAIERVIRELGPVDVLVNNAGITHRSPFRDTDLAVVRRVIEVNLLGSIHCTRASIDSLAATRGTIIVISSVAGFAPLIARTSYAASKHGLHGFFESLRTELLDAGVQVMMVCPTFIETGIEKNAMGADGAPIGRRQLIVGKRATAEEIAEAIFRGAAANKRLLVLGRTARISWWVSRLLPRVYEKIMVRRLRGEIQKS